MKDEFGRVKLALSRFFIHPSSFLRAVSTIRP